MMRTTMPADGELARLAARVDALTGADPLHTSVMRQVRAIDRDVAMLTEMVEISGAMPGEYRIALRFRRDPGGMTMRAVLV